MLLCTFRTICWNKVLGKNFFIAQKCELFSKLTLFKARENKTTLMLNVTGDNHSFVVCKGQYLPNRITVQLQAFFKADLLDLFNLY